jgi:hypothetical protein
MHWECSLVIGIKSAIAALGMLLLSSAASAQEKVDANIVTGLDVSMSLNETEVRNQIAYISMAMQSQEIQDRIAHGRYKRIGFAVYLWSSACAPVIDWRIISTPEEAATMINELHGAVAAIRAAQGTGQNGGLTDTSHAMLCGLEAIKAAPYATYRDVLNIVTNGDDNVGSGPGHSDTGASKLLLEQAGVTVNVMFTPGGGEFDVLLPFFETYVKTGGTSFIINVNAPEKMLEGWRRKFIGDMV